jgi:hypothetical protein
LQRLEIHHGNPVDEEIQTGQLHSASNLRFIPALFPEFESQMNMCFYVPLDFETLELTTVNLRFPPPTPGSSGICGHVFS